MLLWLKKFVQEDAYEIPPRKKIEEKTKNLFLDFQSFMRDNNFDKYEITQSKFSKDFYAELIKENIKGCYKSKTKSSDGVKYIFEKDFFYLRRQTS